MADAKLLFGRRRSFWKKLHRLIATIEPWSILLVAIALVLTVFQFWMDYRDRVNERAVRAWTIVTTAAPGNSGKKEALEYLNSDVDLCLDWLWGWCAFVWKPKTPLIGIDLSHSRLGLAQPPHGLSGLGLAGRGVFLEHANLSEANLSWANLSAANLFAANLSGVNFLQADLSHAFLAMVDLSDADLSHANLSWVFSFDANLTKANLLGADLSAAILPMAILSEANLSHANLARVDLRGGDLCEADLSNVDLSGADLLGAFLFEADLSKADLSGANFSEAHLVGADFSEADVSGANLFEADVSGADLSKVLHLSQVQLDVACAAPDAPPSVPPHLNWEAHECDPRPRLSPALRGTRFDVSELLPAMPSDGIPESQRQDAGAHLPEGWFTMEVPRTWPISSCLSKRAG